MTKSTLCPVCKKNHIEVGDILCRECFFKALNAAIANPRGTAVLMPADNGDTACVMCGQEWGTSLKKDGKYYCSSCWEVWNS